MEHPLFFLAWRRLEPAAQWHDILVRMEDGPNKPLKGNTLSMRIGRVMGFFNIIYTWHGRRDWLRPTKHQLKRLEKISDEAKVCPLEDSFKPGISRAYKMEMLRLYLGKEYHSWLYTRTY